MDAAESGLSERVAELASDLGIRVAVAESLNGGQVSATLAASPGAQKWFAGAVIAYGIDVKQRILGLPDGVDPTSPECARTLAAHMRELLGADVAVATTGVRGPDPQDGHEPGEVHIGRATAAAVSSRRLDFDGDPAQVVHQTVDRALGVLLSAMRSSHAGSVAETNDEIDREMEES